MTFYNIFLVHEKRKLINILFFILKIMPFNCVLICLMIYTVATRTGVLVCSPAVLEDFLGSSAAGLTAIRLDSCHVATGSVLGTSVAAFFVAILRHCSPNSCMCSKGGLIDRLRYFKADGLG
jgi:hypothetical protein